VVVGQPFETVKTRMQALEHANPSMLKTAKTLFNSEGLVGLYRGGTPIVVGGILFRGAQFGCYEWALQSIRDKFGEQPRLMGFFDAQIAAAGVAGGFGRASIEGPFDFIKVRRQVNQQWKFSEMYKGTGVTFARNGILFSAFMTYVDFSKQLFPGNQLGSFLTGSLCTSLAWLTIWPLDVVKSQRQSGNFEGRTSLSLLMEVARTGKLFRGVVPGLSRSAIANGCSMVVYNKVLSLNNKE